MSNDKDIFAPPSKEELDSVFNSPPSEDELKAISNPEDNEPKMFQPGSKSDSFRRGMEQGTTLGFADELSGLTQSGLEKLSKVIPGILPEGVTQTPSDINANLQKQGFTGDLNDTYTSARDDARQLYKQAEEANPASSFAGSVAGTALTSMIPGGAGTKLMQPFGAAAEGSGIIAKMANAAVNAAPIGAVMGVGSSEADNATDIAKDAGKSALTTATIGTGLNLAGQGLSKGAEKTGEFINDKLPSIGRAFEKGKEGIVAFGKDFKDQTNNKLQETTDTLKNFVLGKRNELSQKNDEIVGHLTKQLDNTEKDIINYRDTLLNQSKAGLEKSKLGYAKQIESKLLDQKAKLGKTYDTIENQVADLGLNFNVRNEIADLGETLQNNGLLPEQAQAVMNKFTPYFEKGDLTLPEVKQMKMLANKMMDSQNPAIKDSFKKLYTNLNLNQINTLEQAGITDVANNLRNTNQQYSRLMDLQDNFTGDLTKDRILQKTLTDKDTISTLEKMVKTDAKSLNQNDILSQKAQALDPSFGNLVNNVSQDLQNKSQFINNLPTAPEMVQNSGEMQRLQSLLEKAKAKPEITNQMDALMQSNEKGINEYLGNNLNKVNETINTPAKQNYQNVLDSYKQATGKDITKDVSNLAKDVDLVKGYDKELSGSLSDKSLNMIKGLGQYGSNVAGLGINAAEKGSNTMKNVFKGDIKDVYQNIKRFNTPEADLYAKQLETAMTNNSPESKNAILFGLMQQPAFRKMQGIKKESDK